MTSHSLIEVIKTTDMSGSFYSYENYKADELYNFCIVGKVEREPAPFLMEIICELMAE